jgi:hypothetical protein
VTCGAQRKPWSLHPSLLLPNSVHQQECHTALEYCSLRFCPRSQKARENAGTFPGVHGKLSRARALEINFRLFEICNSSMHIRPTARSPWSWLDAHRLDLLWQEGYESSLILLLLSGMVREDISIRLRPSSRGISCPACSRAHIGRSETPRATYPVLFRSLMAERLLYACYQSVPSLYSKYFLCMR